MNSVINVLYCNYTSGTHTPMGNSDALAHVSFTCLTHGSWNGFHVVLASDVACKGSLLSICSKAALTLSLRRVLSFEASQH
jgi:hypothetical protein